MFALHIVCIQLKPMKQETMFEFKYVHLQQKHIQKANVKWSSDEDDIDTFGLDFGSKNTEQLGIGGNEFGKGGVKRHYKQRLNWYDAIPKNKVNALTDVLFSKDLNLKQIDYKTRHEMFVAVLKPFFEEIIQQTVNVSDYQRRKSVNGMFDIEIVCFVCLYYKYVVC